MRQLDWTCGVHKFCSVDAYREKNQDSSKLTKALEEFELVIAETPIYEKEHGQCLVIEGKEDVIICLHVKGGIPKLKEMLLSKHKAALTKFELKNTK